MLVDYHNHTAYCNHAIGTMDAFLRAAENLGLEEFGFSEHAPWMMGMTDHPLCPSQEGWEAYCREVERLQTALRAEGSPLRLRFGVELDYSPGMEDRISSFLERHDFDYVIGSVHYVLSGDHRGGKPTLARVNNLRHLFELYFEQVESMLRTGLIDVIGHLDLPKRDGDVPEEGYLDFVEALLPALRESGVAVEVNTSGRDKPIREFFPSTPVLRLLIRNQIPITLGSDSHSPRDVGRYIGDAVHLLRDCGLREIATFQKRKKTLRPL